MPGDIKVELGDVGKLIDDVGGFGNTIYSWISGKLSPEEAADLQKACNEHDAKLATLDNAVQLSVLELNKIDAQKGGFQANWRPFLCWTLAIILAIHLGVFPLIRWGCDLAGYDISLPIFDMTQVLVLIGFAFGMRGLEKTGVIKKATEAVETIMKRKTTSPNASQSTNEQPKVKAPIEKKKKEDDVDDMGKPYARIDG